MRTEKNLNIAQLRAYLGRAASVGAAWEQIRAARAKDEDEQERKRETYWLKVNAKQGKKRIARTNFENKRRRYTHINACYRAFWYVKRHCGLVVLKDKNFYSALRKITRIIYGRKLAKRAFARHSAHVFNLIQAERARNVESYSQRRAHACFWVNRVSHPHGRNSIYYIKYNSKIGTTPGKEHNLRTCGAPQAATLGGGLRENYQKGRQEAASPRFAIGGTRIFQRRLPKKVHRLLNVMCDWLEGEHYAFREGCRVYYSRKHAYSLAEYAFKNGISFDVLKNAYKESLRKWHHIAKAGRSTRAENPRKYAPSGVSADTYKIMMEKILRDVSIF